MININLGNNRKIEVYNDRFDVISEGWRLFSFNVASSINKSSDADSDISVKLVNSSDNEYVWQAESTVWNSKEYILKIIDGCFVFRIRVYGKGTIENIEYFKGNCEKPGSRFAVAGYLLLNCQNKDFERSKFLMDVQPAELYPLRAAPPPFVFPFWNEMNNDIIGIGIAAEKGEHNFQKFSLHAPRDGWNFNKCWFELPMCGYTKIDGEWLSPMLWGGFSGDEMETVKTYSMWQYKNLGFGRENSAETQPAWWRGPIFCGWGEQGRLRNIYFCTSADLATQHMYTKFSEQLDTLGLKPTIIIIDDKWQEQYGTLIPDKCKWPDLRSFADWQHQKGRHVLLWFKMWSPEGLPDDECIIYEGKPFCADPTNPKYIGRLREAIHNLLSAEDGCYNCDGFKLDFMDCFPREGGAVIYEKGVYGLELMKRLFSLVYKFAKESRPDALINMSSCHPYFAECCDQFRIHDYDPNLRNPVSIMKYRVDIAKAVMPDVLVDMDGFSGQSREETLRCVLESAKLGVPDLYAFNESFTSEDWTEIKNAWDNYSGQR